MMTNKNLIEALNNCIAHCNYCGGACLKEENMKMMADCIHSDIVCAEICATTVKLLAMDSDMARKMVEICKEACEKCAQECEQHDHQHCKDCAEACRKCADACSTYLS